MPTFSYVAKLEDGRTVSGILEAASQRSVQEVLHRKGLIVVRLKVARALGVHRGGVKLDDLAIFARQMATLVDAGIPIVGGLEAVAEQMENRKMRQVVSSIRQAVEEGTNFTAAIAKQSAIFSAMFISLVRAGEASGHLSEVLERLATYLEKQAAFQRKIQSACIYPAIVFSMAVLITTLLMVKVIPAFKEVFTTLGVALPLPTQILMALSDAIRLGFIPGLGLMALGVVGFRWAIKKPSGRLLWDRFLLRLVVIGPLVRKVAIARFARTLATLVKSGVQILWALEIVADAVGNRVISHAVRKIRSSIREGENISGPLSASGAFPPMVVRMVAVGEQTGRLDDMLAKVADFYEEQVDVAVTGLASAIEPLLIAFLGLVVGSIVVSIFLPIFQLTQLLGR